MAINPDLFECVVCNVQPAQYFDFKATSAGAAYRAAYDARAGNGFTGAQRFVDDPDSAPLCSTHHRLAEKYCVEMVRDEAIQRLKAPNSLVDEQRHEY